ncbi:MAG: PilZ domain protein [candidate division BRC1 bacterium ADurb.BinA364]|nr:MAG: PilZ domain protein [candidate division BRC1 bacterium ADurb.BinA364]
MGDRNKRRGKRFELALPITYALLDSGAPATYRYGHSAILDLSNGGLAMTVEEELPEQALVQAVLRLPARPYVVSALAKVMWRQPADSEGSFKVGLKFMQTPLELNESLLSGLQ